MQNSLKLSIFLTVLLSFGCSPLDPIPEKKDKIYNALNYDIAEISADLKKQEVELKRARKAQKALSPHDPEFAFLREEITRKQHDIAKVRQNLRLLELKRKKRAKYVRGMKLNAARMGEEWTGEEEYQKYKLRHDLIEHAKGLSGSPKMYDPQIELIEEDKVKRQKAKTARELAIESSSK